MKVVHASKSVILSSVLARYCFSKPQDRSIVAPCTPKTSLRIQYCLPLAACALHYSKSLRCRTTTVRAVVLGTRICNCLTWSQIWPSVSRKLHFKKGERQLRPMRHLQRERTARCDTIHFYLSPAGQSLRKLSRKGSRRWGSLLKGHRDEQQDGEQSIWLASMMYAPVSELARAKARLDLAWQHHILPEDLGGVLSRIDCLLRHLLTLGETTFATSKLRTKYCSPLMSGPSNGYSRARRHRDVWCGCAICVHGMLLDAKCPSI